MKKTWKFGLKVADSHSEPGNLQKLEEIFIFFILNFIFFIFFHFFFIFLARGTWNPGKPWKTMKNNGKPSKTKENEKNMKLQMKKNENLDSKLQILTPNQEIFKNEEIFIFFIFFMFFSFSLPVAPEIQESHEKQWKTIKNKEINEKKWSCKWKNMKLQMKKMKFDGKRWTKMKKMR